MYIYTPTCIHTERHAHTHMFKNKHAQLLQTSYTIALPSTHQILFRIRPPYIQDTYFRKIRGKWNCAPNPFTYVLLTSPFHCIALLMNYINISKLLFACSLFNKWWIHLVFLLCSTLIHGKGLHSVFRLKTQFHSLTFNKTERRWCLLFESLDLCFVKSGDIPSTCPKIILSQQHTRKEIKLTQDVFK